MIDNQRCTTVLIWQRHKRKLKFLNIVQNNMLLIKIKEKKAIPQQEILVAGVAGGGGAPPWPVPWPDPLPPVLLEEERHHGLRSIGSRVGAAAGGRALTTARARPDPVIRRRVAHWRRVRPSLLEEAPHGSGHRSASPRTRRRHCWRRPRVGLGAAQPRCACTSCYGLANACLREGGRGEEEEAHGE